MPRHEGMAPISQPLRERESLLPERVLKLQKTLFFHSVEEPGSVGGGEVGPPPTFWLIQCGEMA